MRRLASRIVSLSLMMLLVAFCLLPSMVYATDRVAKHVLVLHSFTPDYPAHTAYNQGLKSELEEATLYQFNYSYEYLDLAHFSNDQDYLSHTAQYFKEKYADHQPDIVVTGDALAPFLTEYGDDIFPGVPVVVSWNKENGPLGQIPPEYVVVPISDDVRQNIELVLQTRPKTNKLYIVLGDSADERALVQRILDIQAEYAARVQLVLLNKLSYEQMLTAIQSAAGNSAIIFFRWTSDVAGGSYIPADVVSTIGNLAKVPVFGASMTFLGRGIVGGYLCNYQAVGQNVANAALQILRGESAISGSSSFLSTNQYAFDSRQLQRWGIAESMLPSGSTIAYKQTSVWDLYGRYVIAAAVLVVLQALLILVLLLNRKRRMRAERGLLQANSSLQSMSEQLIGLDRLKDEFLANTSHELRTPLNGIINIAQSVLEGDPGNLTAAQKTNLEIVRASGSHLYNLINDILDISRLKQGEIRLNLRPTNLGMVASVVIHVLQSLMRGKNVLIQNDIPNDLPAVMADEERLQQILYNLVGNAIKFTPEGTVTVTARVGQGLVEISIADTGIGMPLARLDRILGTFTPGRDDAAREYDGTGLGLSITQKLVELHGSKIWVTSEVGKGSTFSFALPASKDSAESEMQLLNESLTSALSSIAAASQGSSSSGNNGYRILAADDDAANLQAITNVLSLEGYSIRAVSRGQEVLELMEGGNKFDLLILDLMMPGLNGFDVLQSLRARYTSVDLPILVLTAHPRQGDLEAGFDLGANDFLQKPFEARELRARVKTLVQLKSLVTDRVASELLFLQAQIKPHFIFNALSVISSLSIRNPARSKELILDLSDYLRGSFDFENREGLTTLKRELALVRAYLAIEQERFEERLQVDFFIDEDIDCTIPILSIQPLVENAVRHGIMQKLEGGKINVEVRTAGESVTVRVSDNGVGMSGDKVDQLLSGESATGSVGLRNIHRRLITLYGKGLAITSTGAGTTVEYQIPYRKAEWA